MESNQFYTDLYWQVQGYSIPADYRYWLYAGLALLHPPLKTDTKWRWQLGGINGAIKAGSLHLDEKSRLHVRTPSDRVPELIAALANAVVRVGPSLIQLAGVEGEPVVAQQHLQSAVVSFKFAEEKHRGHRVNPFRFGVTLGKQMAALGIRTPPRLGARASFRIRSDVVRGFAVEYINLEPAESIALQIHGIGGSRRIGAGVFVPPC